MTWVDPLPWRCTFDGQALTVFDERGQVQAVATVDWAAPELKAPRPGVAGRVAAVSESLSAALDRRTPVPHDLPPSRVNDALTGAERWLSQAGQAIQQRIWSRGHGTLPEGCTAVLALPTGETGVAVNGASDGNMRVNRWGILQVYGRRYQLRHQSRRLTHVVRDDTAAGGIPVATLRRKGLAWQSFRPTDVPPKCLLSAAGPLDLADRLAVHLVATMLGPAGRTGWISRTFYPF